MTTFILSAFRPCCVALGLVLVTSSISAAATAAEKCEAGKLKETGKLAACLFKTEAKAVQSGSPVDGDALTTCESKFTQKSSAAETKADGECPTSNDSAALVSMVQDLSARVTGRVSGSRFGDNGDGTVTDHERGVVWQQQVAGAACPACVDEQRGYADMAVFLGSLGGTSTAEALGGYRNWGLPTIEDLQSIVDCSEPPCMFVDPVLGPNPTLPAMGSSYLLSGTYDVEHVPPCFKVLRLQDGTIECIEAPSVLGSSRARVMNNAR